MKKQITLFLLLSTIIFSVANAAPIETFKFESAENEKIFHKLSEELRCLVCQNQNIAESNSDLAKDLRLEIYNMLSQGKTEDQIVDFMVQRYGDYVLYRPPFKPMTWLLWFGPAIIFIAGTIFAIRLMKTQSSAVTESGLSEDEIKRVKSLHADQHAKQVDKEGNRER